MEIAGCPSVGLAARTLVVAPPGRRVRIVVTNGSRGGHVAVACVSMRVVYQGLVSVFDRLYEPIVDVPQVAKPLPERRRSAHLRAPM